jgi:hypothetical protein
VAASFSYLSATETSCQEQGDQRHSIKKEDFPVHYGIDLSVQNRVLRTREHWHPIVEPGLWISYRSFTGYVWGSHYMHKRGRSTSDIHYALDYRGTSEKWNYTIGIEHHVHLSGRWSHTNAYASIGFDGFLNPTVTISKGLRSLYGYSVSFNLHHRLERKWLLTRSIPLFVELDVNTTYGSRKHNKANYSVYQAGFSNVGAGISLPIEINQNWKLTPYLTYTVLLDPIKKYRLEDKRTSTYGLALSASW